MAASTTRYGLQKPTVGADADLWGGYLNTDLDDIDAIAGAITTTGSANAYVLTTSLSLAAYVAGQSFDIKANFTNSGAATINVDTLGAKDLRKNGTTALASGDIVSGNIYRISYDGTVFQVLGSVGAGNQPLDATLTAFAALTTADDRMLDFTGVDTMAVVTYATVLSNIAAAPLAGATLTGAYLFANGAVGSPSISFASDSNDGIYRIGSHNYGWSNGGTKHLDMSATVWEWSVVDLRPTLAPNTLATNSVGFRGTPQNQQGATNYTLVLADAGKQIFYTSGSGHTYTIPPNSSVAFPIGTRIDIYAIYGGSSLSIAPGVGVTLILAGGSTSGTRTLASGGYCRLHKIDTDLWVIEGTGVT